MEQIAVLSPEDLMAVKQMLAMHRIDVLQYPGHRQWGYAMWVERMRIKVDEAIARMESDQLIQSRADHQKARTSRAIVMPI